MNLKYFTFLILLLVFSPLFSQKSESLIPKDAVIVFSINNFKLLQKISLDELINYEFMEEIHQELFDGSTSGKTLKEAGLGMIYTAIILFFGFGIFAASNLSRLDYRRNQKESSATLTGRLFLKFLLQTFYTSLQLPQPKQL